MLKLLVLASLLIGTAQPSVGGESGVAAWKPVDLTRKPWSAIGVLNNSVYGRCTTILVRADLAVTAAHCLYNARTKRFVRPQSVHVLFGFDRGSYAFHTTIADIVMSEGYDPERPRESVAEDWAVLRLLERVPDERPPIAIADRATPLESVLAAGYGQERREALTVTDPCGIEGETADGVLVSDCVLSHGFSGGPLVDRETGALLGMNVALSTTRGKPIALAVPAWRMVGKFPPE